MDSGPYLKFRKSTFRIEENVPGYECWSCSFENDGTPKYGTGDVCPNAPANKADKMASCRMSLSYRLLEFPAAETVLVLGHVDALAAEANTLHFEARALFEAGFEFQLDCATRAHDPLPG